MPAPTQDMIYLPDDLELFANLAKKTELDRVDLGEFSQGSPDLPEFISNLGDSFDQETFVKLLLYCKHVLPFSRSKKKQRKAYHYENMAGVDPNDTPTINIEWLPGQTLGGIRGPSPLYEVMVVGKYPSYRESMLGQIFSDEDGELLVEELEKNKIDPRLFYFTNVCKFYPPEGKITADCQRMCKYFLHQEIAIVRPKELLLLGSEAVKAVFGPKATLGSYMGKSFPHPVFEDTNVHVSLHPSAVLTSPKEKVNFEDAIKLFCLDYLGEGWEDRVKCDYSVLDNLEDLNRKVDALIADGVDLFAVDCEWGGRRHTNGDLMTIQVAWDTGKAFLIHLRSEGRVPVFSPDVDAAAEPLRRLLCRPDVKIVGHWLASDILWLMKYGVDIRKNFYFDTMLAYHVAVDEAGDQSLDACRVRYTNMPKYDTELSQYKKQFQSKYKRDGGYGEIPDAILHPYALKDVDCEFRCYEPLKKILESDPVISDLFYQIIMPANLPIIEIRDRGMLVDKERYDVIQAMLAEKSAELLARIRHETGYPHFNPRSVDQLKKLLFDDLELTPLTSTDKLPWDENSVANNLSPSCDKATLDAYSDDYEELRLINAYKTVDKQIGLFKPPKVTEDGVKVYESGILKFLDSDQRIRGTFSPTAVTGRLKSSDPNFQNLAKRIQESLDVIFDNEIPPVRSMFRADLDNGYVLVEADYSKLEVVLLALISGDMVLLADALSPINFHSRNAVDVLGAKSSYESVKKDFPGLYVSAKTVSFGIPYRMGNRAMARSIRQAGTECTDEQAQHYIDAYLSKYSKVKAFLEKCESAVYDPGYTVTAYGRRRRFKHFDEPYRMRAQQREACNAPIQGTAVDALNKAMYNLYMYREQHPELDFFFVNTIHDAVILEIHVSCLEVMLETVIPYCVTNSFTVPGTQHNLGSDLSLFLNWGETPSEADLKAFGVSDKCLSLINGD